MPVEFVQSHTKVGTRPLGHGRLAPTPGDDGLDGVGPPLDPENELYVHHGWIEARPAVRDTLRPFPQKLADFASVCCYSCRHLSRLPFMGFASGWAGPSHRQPGQDPTSLATHGENPYHDRCRTAGGWQGTEPLGSPWI